MSHLQHVFPHRLGRAGTNDNCLGYCHRIAHKCSLLVWLQSYLLLLDPGGPPSGLNCSKLLSTFVHLQSIAKVLFRSICSSFWTFYAYFWPSWGTTTLVKPWKFGKTLAFWSMKMIKKWLICIAEKQSRLPSFFNPCWASPTASKWWRHQIAKMWCILLFGALWQPSSFPSKASLPPCSIAFSMET